MKNSNVKFSIIELDKKSGDLVVPVLTKKEIKSLAKEEAEKVLDDGEKDVASVVVDAVRVTEYLTEFVKQLKPEVSEEEYGKDYEIKGAKISFRGSGDKLNYEEDSVYADLKRQLKEREEILKLAYKTKGEIYDSDACLVEKVRIKTFSKQSVVITY